MDWLEQLQNLGLVGLSGLLGGIVGLDRELAHRPAGLRTHIFVASASTLLLLLGESVVNSFDVKSSVSIRTDPVRMVEAVTVGVSFLGAGTIWRAEGGRVRGLTTAASILMTCGIGLAVAADRLLLAAGAAVFTFAVLRVIALFERHVTNTKPSAPHGPDERSSDR